MNVIIFLCLFSSNIIGDYKTPTMVHYETNQKILIINNIDVVNSKYYYSAKFELVTDIPAVIFKLIERKRVYEFEDPEWHNRHQSLFSDNILTVEYLTIDDKSEHWDIVFKYLGGDMFELIEINKSK